MLIVLVKADSASWSLFSISNWLIGVYCVASLFVYSQSALCTSVTEYQNQKHACSVILMVGVSKINLETLASGAKINKDLQG